MNSVSFFSREVIIATPGNPNKALISISCPGDPAPLQSGWGRILRLEFDDIDRRSMVDWYKKTTGKTLRLFDENQAQTVIDFIDTLPKTIDVLVVHCDAGVSRSAAIARFSAMKLGCPLQGDDRLANAHVLSVLNKINRTWETLFGGSELSR